MHTGVNVECDRMFHLLSNLLLRSIKEIKIFFEKLNFYFTKTASFGILIIKIPDRMLTVQILLDTMNFRVHLWALAALAPFGILIS